MKTLLTLSCLVLALSASPLYAKTIYQCKDARGQTVFSDGPCADQALGSRAKAATDTNKASTAAQTKKLTPPATLTECDKTGCWSGNVRYNKINADNYVSSTGKSCKRVGNTMHCN